jgi:hypothetical protein
MCYSFDGKDGRRIEGVKLHYSYPDPNGNVVGRVAASSSVSFPVFDSCGHSYKDFCTIVGTDVNLDFTDKGKVCGITF